MLCVRMGENRFIFLRSEQVDGMNSVILFHKLSEMLVKRRLRRVRTSDLNLLTEGL